MFRGMTDETGSMVLRPKPRPATPLARWMRRTGWGVVELAEQAGVDKAVISRLANGVRTGMSEETERKLRALTGLRRIV